MKDICFLQTVYFRISAGQSPNFARYIRTHISICVSETQYETVDFSIIWYFFWLAPIFSDVDPTMQLQSNIYILGAE